MKQGERIELMMVNCECEWMSDGECNVDGVVELGWKMDRGIHEEDRKGPAVNLACNGTYTKGKRELRREIWIWSYNE